MDSYKLVNVVDSTLEDITSTITLPIISGSNSSTYQTFNAQSGSAGSNQVQFNVQLPSLNTCISRHVLLQSKVTLKIDFEGGTQAGYWSANQVLFNYGNCNSLQSFPINSLFNTVNANLNNANINCPTQEILPALLKMFNYEELAKYNSLTPSLVDSFYQNFQDGLLSNNNVMGNYAIGTFAKEYQPRGVFTVSLTTDPAGTNPLPNGGTGHCTLCECLPEFYIYRAVDRSQSFHFWKFQQLRWVPRNQHAHSHDKFEYW